MYKTSQINGIIFTEIDAHESEKKCFGFNEKIANLTGLWIESILRVVLLTLVLGQGRDTFHCHVLSIPFKGRLAVLNSLSLTKSIFLLKANRKAMLRNLQSVLKAFS